MEWNSNFLKGIETGIQRNEMKSGYNFTNRAFFDVMNEESMYVWHRKGGEAFNSAHKDVVKRACCR